MTLKNDSGSVMEYWSSGKKREMHMIDIHLRSDSKGLCKDQTVQAKNKHLAEHKKTSTSPDS